jgi:Fe-S-cluster containining protein
MPGACCKSMVLSLPFYIRDAGEADVNRWVANVREIGAADDAPPLPFVAAGRKPRGADGDEVWVFDCPKLDDATGRCTIYDTRPQLCRNYAPLEDGLCVHFGGLEGYGG